MADVDDGSQNPYSAPRAELRDPAEPRASEAAFYAISPRKLVVMSILTLNFYDYCFWWKQWRTRRERGEDVSVFWRTFFAPFMAFSFTNRVKISLISNNLPVSGFFGMIPGLYLSLHFLDRAISRLSGLEGATPLVLDTAVVLARACLMFQLQKEVNRVLSAERYDGAFNRGATAGTYLVAAVGVLAWLGLSYGALHPSADGS